MDKFHGGQELSRFTKNSCEEIRLVLLNFGVGRYVDFRIWSRIRPGDSMPTQPTEHGFALDEALLLDLRTAIDRALAVLNGPEAGQDARPQTSGHEGRGLIEGESGDLRPEGEKRGPEKPQDERSPEGDRQGQGPGGGRP